MDRYSIKNLIMYKRDKDVIEALNSGWDPNYDGGWSIRLAARYGCYNIVEILIRHGANPHLLSESGASTLQLAVFSGEHWDTDCWNFLLSCCDSSQLADGAAVAIIFNNKAALRRILDTGRCNAHIPTSLTGKTLDHLAKGYKVSHLLNTEQSQTMTANSTSLETPRRTRMNRTEVRNTLHPATAQRNLSPSVARFFQQTAGQSSLTSPSRATAVDATSRMSPFF